MAPQLGLGFGGFSCRAAPRGGVEPSRGGEEPRDAVERGDCDFFFFLGREGIGWALIGWFQKEDDAEARRDPANGTSGCGLWGRGTGMSGCGMWGRGPEMSGCGLWERGAGQARVWTHQLLAMIDR